MQKILLKMYLCYVTQRIYVQICIFGLSLFIFQVSKLITANKQTNKQKGAHTQAYILQ
jgi:hypothetical protein